MIEDYNTDRVTVCNPTTDEWDRITWFYTEYDCRLERYEKTIQKNGESIKASWRIFLPYDADVRGDSRIYLGVGLQNAGTGSSGSPSGGTGNASPLPNEVFLVIDRNWEKDFDKNHLEIRV